MSRNLLNKVKTNETVVGKKGIWEGLHFKSERFALTRKIVAYKTSESWVAVPHCAYNYEPDVTEFMEVYKALKNKYLPEQNITFNSLMLKVVVEGIKAAPNLNAYCQYNRLNSRGSIDTIEEINISMPYRIDDETTITVNLQNMHTKTLSEINAAVDDIRRRAANTNLEELYYRVAFKESMEDLKELEISMVIRRLFAGKVGKDKVHPLGGKAKTEYDKIPETERLTIKDVRQGTLVVTNLGSLTQNTRGAASLIEIVPPQILAVALSAVQEKPGIIISENGEKVITPRKFLPINLVFDHRACDFDALVPFMKKLDEIFANPNVMLEW